MKTLQRNVIALIFIFSIDTRIHAIQVFHIFFKLIYKFIKRGKSNIINSLWSIGFDYFISKLRKYNIWSFQVVQIGQFNPPARWRPWASSSFKNCLDRLQEVYPFLIILILNLIKDSMNFGILIFCCILLNENI
jgi:hypothetical protein